MTRWLMPVVAVVVVVVAPVAFIAVSYFGVWRRYAVGWFVGGGGGGDGDGKEEEEEPLSSCREGKGVGMEKKIKGKVSLCFEFLWQMMLVFLLLACLFICFSVFRFSSCD